MTERDQPYGSYSEALPMDKLKELTNARLAEHAEHTDDDVRNYAEQVVKEELGPTVQSSENIVNALVEEILRDVKD